MKLVVLDYSNSSVNIHNVDTKKESEKLLEELGYKESNCEWMISRDLKLNIYND